MAAVLSLTWAGVTPEQYEAVREQARWEEQVPPGLVLHVAWFEGGALRVTDVWNRREDFESFFAERLAPAVEKAGISGAPASDFLPLHRRFVAAGVTGAG
ncbi:hypothetical protein [Streptomyces sp. NPDC048603]|uniref:hypothetical protein n=1 Tax=Streptomyces sp. NPDC048603 TaxID=3365577 RepID=UPI00371EC398